MKQLHDALAYSLELTRRNLQTLQDFPERCEGPHWTCVAGDGSAPTRAHWVDGFWTGLLWLAYAHTGDELLERGARTWTARLAWLRQETGTHDLGFIFDLSHVLGAQLTGDSRLSGNALAAATTMLRRYNAQGEFFQAWGAVDGPAAERGRTNVDLMMNLALLFWASQQTADQRFASAAAGHARTSRLALVRPDGSTVHVADFDPDTGAFLQHATWQGLSPDSCWSRGQAWALYGFTECYRWTGAPVFLATARRLAQYALRRAPADMVPFWDYDSPEIPSTVRDSSAAAIMAAGLLDLAACEPAPDAAGRWRAAAEQMLASLWQNYSSRGSSSPAILLHGTRSLPHGLADHGLIYGDYYFVEALTKLLRPDLAARGFAAHAGVAQPVAVAAEPAGR